MQDCGDQSRLRRIVLAFSALRFKAFGTKQSRVEIKIHEKLIPMRGGERERLVTV